MMFASDNASGAHPAVLEALVVANAGAAMPYGNDAATARVEDMIREIFEAPRARVLLVATGTAANAITLAGLCPPWSAIYCHDIAHIEIDECNAPEFYTGGAKLAHVAGDHAMMGPDALEARLAISGPGVVHMAQPGAVSITQATERGAVYPVEAIARLAAIANAHGLPVHMDGTRLANALAATGASPAEMTHRAGVDVLCLGATKAGVMAAEAIVLFEPEARPNLAWELELRRKRGGHLFSKMRFVAAQLEAWLSDGLWLELAAHANAMASRLHDGLAGLGLVADTPPGANLMYLHLPGPTHAALQAAGAVYYTHDRPFGAVEARLVTSWSTTPAEVETFLATCHTAAA
ncbi:MAG: beta-eliminating lyase-related protein [Pseudomonadota bacterium]